MKRALQKVLDGENEIVTAILLTTPEDHRLVINAEMDAGALPKLALTALGPEDPRACYISQRQDKQEVKHVRQSMEELKMGGSEGKDAISLSQIRGRRVKRVNVGNTMRASYLREREGNLIKKPGQQNPTPVQDTKSMIEAGKQLMIRLHQQQPGAEIAWNSWCTANPRFVGEAGLAATTYLNSLPQPMEEEMTTQEAEFLKEESSGEPTPEKASMSTSSSASAERSRSRSENVSDVSGEEELEPKLFLCKDQWKLARCEKNEKVIRAYEKGIEIRGASYTSVFNTDFQHFPGLMDRMHTLRVDNRRKTGEMFFDTCILEWAMQQPYNPWTRETLPNCDDMTFMGKLIGDTLVGAEAVVTRLKNDPDFMKQVQRSEVLILDQLDEVELFTYGMKRSLDDMLWEVMKTLAKTPVKKYKEVGITAPPPPVEEVHHFKIEKLETGKYKISLACRKRNALVVYARKVQKETISSVPETSFYHYDVTMICLKQQPVLEETFGELESGVYYFLTFTFPLGEPDGMSLFKQSRVVENALRLLVLSIFDRYTVYYASNWQLLDRKRSLELEPAIKKARVDTLGLTLEQWLMTQGKQENALIDHIEEINDAKVRGLAITSDPGNAVVFRYYLQGASGEKTYLKLIPKMGLPWSIAKLNYYIAFKSNPLRDEHYERRKKKGDEMENQL